MCLIAFAWRAHSRFDLLVAANRDEFHERPARAAHWWPRPAGLFAGRDERAGGAWCGAGRDGRFAAVTNVREPGARAGDWSRGVLVRDYFSAAYSARQWVDWVSAHDRWFAPFNLLVGDRETLWFASNRGRVRALELRPGVHAISNGHWGDHWPKTERAGAGLRAYLSAGRVDPEPLFALMAEAEPAAVPDLPDTGIGVERERFLSPLFIQSRDYGTRATTVIRRSAAGADFHERAYDPAAQAIHAVDESWMIANRLRNCVDH